MLLVLKKSSTDFEWSAPILFFLQPRLILVYDVAEDVFLWECICGIIPETPVFGFTTLPCHFCCEQIPSVSRQGLGSCFQMA